MLAHHGATTHPIALSFRDLSVWCFSCDSYLDAQVIPDLRPAFDAAHLMKFGVLVNQMDGEEVGYHSQDFQWEELRAEVERSGSCVHGDAVETVKTLGCQIAAWEKFHSSHSHGLFFKERRYLLKEFPELASPGRRIIALEIGCGAGSSTIPILRGNKNAIVRACDVSDAALSITKKMAERILLPDEIERRLLTFRCDPSLEPLPAWLACESYRALGSSACTPHCCGRGVDFITMIFTLSAVPPERMKKLVEECYTVLRVGGMLLFRDYGLYDMTMLRFPLEQKLGSRSFFRLDGTLSYFFSCESVRDLFKSVGFVEEEVKYCCVKLLNRRKNVPMKRVWVHAKFRKPHQR